MIREAVAKLAENGNLTREETHAAMREIMSGEASPPQIAAFLIGLRVKGETAEEITGCAEAMREKASKVKTKHPVVIDTCGTGGDAVGTFNVSTAAALVASGGGAVVAKHGNRAVSSRCGSADVLIALGVKVEDVPVERVERCLDEIGIAFLFAPLLHGAMKYAAPVRRELSVRTIFNILGPLTNPAGVSRQVIGVYDRKLAPVLAAVLKELGTKHALVVHGAGGFDEISTCGPTAVSEVFDGKVENYTLDHGDYGFVRASIQDLLGADPVTNAGIIREILDGRKGPQRDIVVLNSGAALYVSGAASTLKEGVSMAEESIDSGAARRKLARLVEATNA